MNPLGFAYENVTGVKDYKASAVIVTGRGNRYHGDFQIARSNGVEVYAYLIPVAMDPSPNPIDLGFFMGDYKKVPLWGTRLAKPGIPLVDISVGSIWADWVVDYIGKLILEKKFEGAFLDVLGARPWMKLAAWEMWSPAEQKKWTDGAVDLARRIHEKRMQLDPNFKIIHNNEWRLDPRGEQYCNGVCIEHHPAVVDGKPSFHANYVGKTFAKGLVKRNLVIAMNAADAQAWAKVPGATHVCAQQSYEKVEATLVPFEDVRIKELQDQLTALEVKYMDELIEHAVTTDALHKAENALVTCQDWVDRLGRKQASALRQAQDLVSILAV